MDPRYEKDINKMVKGMGDEEFTAGEVVAELRNTTTNPFSKGMPEGKDVGMYLKKSTIAVKTKRKRGLNYYRYAPPSNGDPAGYCDHHVPEVECVYCNPIHTPPPDLEAEKVQARETLEALSLTPDAEADEVETMEAIAEHEARHDMDMKPPPLTQEQLDAMIKEAQDSCIHEWVYQDPATVCPKCNSYRDVEEPDVLKNLVREIHAGSLSRVSNRDLYEMMQGFTAWSNLLKEKDAAVRSAENAKACALALVMRTDKNIHNIRRKQV